jgi:hypothetical protein
VLSDISYSHRPSIFAGRDLIAVARVAPRKIVTVRLDDNLLSSKRGLPEEWVLDAGYRSRRSAALDEATTQAERKDSALRGDASDSWHETDTQGAPKTISGRLFSAGCVTQFRPEFAVSKLLEPVEHS